MLQPMNYMEYGVVPTWPDFQLNLMKVTNVTLKHPKLRQMHTKTCIDELSDQFDWQKF